MKKFVFALVFLLTVVGVAVAAPYWLPTQVGTYDKQVTTGRTVIVDASIYYKGVTAGDRVDFCNGTSGSNTIFYSFVAPDANGTYPVTKNKKDWVANSGLYIDFTLTGGIMGIDLEYSE